MAEAVAEGRGKAQAATLRATRKTTTAERRLPDGSLETVAASDLTIGDLVVVRPNEVIPGDGDVVEGMATVDESAITGESAPVIRESGGDRSAVTGGTTVLSDGITVRITTKPGETFIDRMIALVEGASRQKTPNEIALTILLTVLTIIFLLAVMAMQPMAVYSGQAQSPVVLVALLVCLIPTTIGALLSAIGIAGMDRLVQHNVLAMSGRAVEAAGDVVDAAARQDRHHHLGNRRATELLAAPGLGNDGVARAAYVSSLADETPEGRSIVELGGVGARRARARGARPAAPGGATFVEFSAATRMSGVDLPDGTAYRKGAADSVARWVHGPRRRDAERCAHRGRRHRDLGWHPARRRVEQPGQPPRVLGVIHLKDVVKPGMKERFAQLRSMGIRTVMITGDNPLTAKSIAAEAGVDDFLAEATPGGQDGPHQARAGRRPARRHDRRRHERRAGAGPGRRRRGDEHRHVRGQGGRQHGRPRLRPDEAHRHRLHRQAAAHHPRSPDDVLDRQRHREVLRDHPGDVRRPLPGLDALNIMRPALAEIGDPLGGHLQRARSSSR